ncbi:MAG: sigma-70 family RNA polymerase sigma factor [Pseudomonadota bacterium]
MQPSSSTSHDDLARAFAELNRRLHGYLAKYVDDDVAEDLLQDVFVKALKAISENRNPDNLAAWLFTAARTTAIDHLRAKGKPQVDDSVLELIESPAEQSQSENELAECLRPMVNQLPEKYRSTLVATDLERESMKHVAEREGVSLSAIKSRAGRGRSMLRDLVMRCCQVEFEDGSLTEYIKRAPHSDCCS